MAIIDLLAGASIAVAIPLFLAATAVVAVVAPRLTSTVNTFAERTSFGSSLVGSVLLGASTSLPGIIVTVLATLRGDIALAAANAVGGVAAQTTFLAVADLSQPRGDVFEETSGPQELAGVGSLLVLLAIPLFAIAGWPSLEVGRVHPASIVLVVVYGAGLWFTHRQGISQNSAHESDEGDTPPDDRDDAAGDDAAGDDAAGDDEVRLGRVWLRYGVYVALVGVAGVVIGTTISPIAEALGLTSIAAGALLTAGATSSPELITSVTAARRGQLHLAVGDIVGGNNFDVLFLAAADVAVAGSLYMHLGGSVVLLVATSILLNSVLLLGFARRRGSESVSPESAIMVGIYAALAVALLVAPPNGGG